MAVSDRYLRLPVPVRRAVASLTPRERVRLGGVAVAIIGLFVVGFVLLLAAAPHHYRV